MQSLPETAKFCHGTQLILALRGMLTGVGGAPDERLTQAACKVWRTFTTVSHAGTTIPTWCSNAPVKQCSTFTVHT